MIWKHCKSTHFLDQHVLLVILFPLFPTLQHLGKSFLKWLRYRKLIILIHPHLINSEISSKDMVSPSLNLAQNMVLTISNVWLLKVVLLSYHHSLVNYFDCAYQPQPLILTRNINSFHKCSKNETTLKHLSPTALPSVTIALLMNFVPYLCLWVLSTSVFGVSFPVAVVISQSLAKRCELPS